MLLLSAAALCGSAPSAVAAATKRVKTSARLIYQQVAGVPNGCFWGIGVVVGAVPGATSYAVSYYDGYYKQMESGTFTPKQLMDFAKQSGLGGLFLGITGGSNSGPCGDNPPDPTEGGRFSRGAKAVAIVPGKKPELSGNVVAQRCSASSCSRRPLAGATVVARDARTGKTGRTRTGRDGGYSMRLAAGTWDVSLAGVKGIPEKREVNLDRNVSGVDFRSCTGKPGMAAASDVGSSCGWLVHVKLVDRAGLPVANFPVRATLGSSIAFVLPDSADARTNAAGVATLELYESSWSLSVGGTTADINENFTGYNSAPSSEPPFHTTLSSCEDGKIIDGFVCALDLELGKVPHSLSVDGVLQAAPVDLTLSSGTGRDAVYLTPQPAGTDETLVYDAAAPASRVHLELPLLNATSWVVQAIASRTTASKVSACVPGSAAPFQSVDLEVVRPACFLDLGGVGPRGAVTFSLPNG